MSRDDDGACGPPPAAPARPAPTLRAELRREPRDVGLRPEPSDRALRVDIDAGLLRAVDRVDERLHDRPSLRDRQVDAAGRLLPGEDQLLGLEGAAVADVGD